MGDEGVRQRAQLAGRRLGVAAPLAFHVRRLDAQEHAPTVLVELAVDGGDGTALVVPDGSSARRCDGPGRSRPAWAGSSLARFGFGDAQYVAGQVEGDRLGRGFQLRQGIAVPGRVAAAPACPLVKVAT